MNIGILIYEEAEILDFSGPFEVFSTASRVCGDAAEKFTPILIHETADTVTARAGYRVVPHANFNNHPSLDVLVVAGGVHENAMDNPAVIQWLKQQGQHVSLITSVCTGAFLLAEAGLLTDETVTTHHEDREDLQTRFPKLTVIGGVRWVDEGDRVTSGGISAGIDMSLHLVSRLHSRELAEATAEKMEYHWIQKN